MSASVTARLNGCTEARASGGAAHGFTKFYRESFGRSEPAATYTDDQDESRARLVRRPIRGAGEGVTDGNGKRRCRPAQEQKSFGLPRGCSARCRRDTPAAGGQCWAWRRRWWWLPWRWWWISRRRLRRVPWGRISRRRVSCWRVPPWLRAFPRLVRRRVWWDLRAVRVGLRLPRLRLRLLSGLRQLLRPALL